MRFELSSSRKRMFGWPFIAFRARLMFCAERSIPMTVAASFSAQSLLSGPVPQPKSSTRFLRIKSHRKYVSNCSFRLSARHWSYFLAENVAGRWERSPFGLPSWARIEMRNTISSRMVEVIQRSPAAGWPRTAGPATSQTARLCRSSLKTCVYGACGVPLGHLTATGRPRFSYQKT